MRAMAAHPPMALFQPPLSDIEDLAAALAEAERRRREVVQTYSTDRIIAALAGAAADWLRPDEPLRALAIEEVARTSGFHSDMVATGIDFIFSVVTVEALERLAGAVAASASRAVFHSLAGNVPGQGVPAIARSLLARSIAIIRDSERQPVLTAAFRETIRRYEPALAAMVLPVAWSHGDTDRSLESAVVKAAERIELYGSDRTVGGLASRYRSGAPLACELHGARVSAGLVPMTADLAEAAKGFAVDVTMYEGRGCLTPHVILVEGAPARANALADALATELANCERRWPRARGSAEEELERRRFVDAAELRALATPEGNTGAARCLAGPASTWCVEQAAEATIMLGPGLRCVRVACVPGRGEAIAALRAATPALAGVGVAGATTDSGRDGIDDVALAADLQRAGATLVCPAGRMQAPPVDWRPRANSVSGDHAGGLE